MSSPSSQQERAPLLEQRAQIDRMIRGQVSQPTSPVTRRGQTLPRGPSFRRPRREHGKNNWPRVGTEELDSIVAGVAACHRFQQLAERYARRPAQMAGEAPAPGLPPKFQRCWRRSSRTPRAV